MVFLLIGNSFGISSQQSTVGSNGTYKTKPTVGSSSMGGKINSKPAPSKKTETPKDNNSNNNNNNNNNNKIDPYEQIRIIAVMEIYKLINDDGGVN